MIQQKETATTSHREVCPRHLCSTPRIHVQSVNKDFNSVFNFVENFKWFKFNFRKYFIRNFQLILNLLEN